MGNQLVKSGGGVDREAPIPKMMSKKYGEIVLDCADYWVSMGIFPKTGTLSIQKLNEMKEKLEKQWEAKKKDKRIKVRDYKQWESCSKCVGMWLEEAECRDRRKNGKQLAGVGDEGGAVIGRTDNASAPPPLYNTLLSPPPCVSVQAAKVDPDLDVCPPRRPINPHPLQVFSIDTSHPVPTPRAPRAGVLPSSPLRMPDSTDPALMGGAADESLTSKTRSGRAYHHEGGPAGPSTSQMPMVEVSGPDGPILVFRPWTFADLKENAAFLPNPVDDGAKFATELRTFCQEHRPTGVELRRLLGGKMGPSDLAKIRDKIPRDDLRVQQTEWAHAENAVYREAVEKLCTALTEVFPSRGSLTALRALKQRPDEAVEDFVCRAEEEFTKNSGLARPSPLGDSAGPWEKLLCQTMMDGFLKDIGTVIRSHYVGMAQVCRLEELVRHAHHAQDVVRQRQKDRDDKQAKSLSSALTLLAMPRNNGERRGGGKGPETSRAPPVAGGRGGPPSREGACHLCGRQGHWKRDCPQRKRRRQPRRGNRGGD
ncbi:uncharacterized protein LOC115438785 isoform X1 [Sphaeramia orbicularis]|uniref:uncharacterized protein LOC115438785 isoform X1 n=1 Tax=Sphaeramia orbicularis TaxID=375764 RepID=UPI00117E44C6|nr:uncharacterized protein LOC115438785 isoform X1 [Sphaeramia orbicularis]XP_030018482.1 uncharacterized protein LOC115438785 isoform X1 [Sphaeramia orbicularis]